MQAGQVVPQQTGKIFYEWTSVGTLWSFVMLKQERNLLKLLEQGYNIISQHSREFLQ